MDDTKREELEKACKKEKDHKVRTRMVAICMVRVPNISVEETADILVRCSMWVRDWLRRYDEGGLEGLRDLPRCGGAQKNSAKRHGWYNCKRGRLPYHIHGSAAGGLAPKTPQNQQINFVS